MRYGAEMRRWSMSIFASILRMAYKLSGAKKVFALPEDALQKEIVKQNWTAPHLLDSMVYCLGNGVFLYAKGNTTEKI